MSLHFYVWYTCEFCYGLTDDEESGGIFVPSCARKFATIAEAIRNATAGDVIRLCRVLFEEPDTIVLDKNALVLEAANSADSKDPAGWAPVTVSFTGDQKKGIVCSGQGIRVEGIRFTMHSKQTQEPSTLEQQQTTSCIVVESGDASFTDCYVSNSAVRLHYTSLHMLKNALISA
jgi:hypothetical protein